MYRTYKTVKISLHMEGKEWRYKGACKRLQPLSRVLLFYKLESNYGKTKFDKLGVYQISISIHFSGIHKKM